MKMLFRRLGSAAWVLLVLNLFVIFTVIGSLVAAWGYSRDVDRTEHTISVRDNVRDFLISYAKGESGQRAFLSTGQDKDYADFLYGGKRAAQFLGVIRQLTADNPVQQARVSEIEKLIRLKDAEMTDTVIAVRAGKKDDALRRIGTGEGWRYTQAIDAQAGEILAEEDQLLVRRRRARDTVVAVNIATASVALLFSLFTLALMVYHRFYKDYPTVPESDLYPPPKGTPLPDVPPASVAGS